MTARNGSTTTTGGYAPVSRYTSSRCRKAHVAPNSVLPVPVGRVSVQTGFAAPAPASSAARASARRPLTAAPGLPPTYSATRAGGIAAPRSRRYVGRSAGGTARNALSASSSTENASWTRRR